MTRAAYPEWTQQKFRLDCECLPRCGTAGQQPGFSRVSALLVPAGETSGHGGDDARRRHSKNGAGRWWKSRSIGRRSRLDLQTASSRSPKKLAGFHNTAWPRARARTKSPMRFWRPRLRPRLPTLTVTSPLVAMGAISFQEKNKELLIISCSMLARLQDARAKLGKTFSKSSRWIELPG